jgi:hypothetical protein
MKTAFAVVVAVALLAACDRPPQPRTAPSPAAGQGPSSPMQPAPQTGAPSAAEKREGGNPVQGQVDPKDAAQHKDFQQKGDGAGPTSPETKPKSGG